MTRFLISVLVILTLAFSFTAEGHALVLGEGDNAVQIQEDKPGQKENAKDKARPSGSKSIPQPPPSQAAVSPVRFDYSANLESDVFGANLFTGAFARQGAAQFNPDYLIAIGDKLQVLMWGAFEFSEELTVDPQGNVFLPHVGPVKVLGVRNKDLEGVIEAAAKKIFSANVSTYAALAAAQPVRVFVGGFVNRPGMYAGTSMDSLLQYLDQAGGIDAERGTFLDIQVKRAGEVRASVNLYDFMLEGRMPFIQLADGDIIFVPQRQNTVMVTGMAENAKRFEFSGRPRTVGDLVKIAKPLAQATHVRIVRSTGTIKNVEYYPLAEANTVVLNNGDELEFAADKKPGTITVRVEGEHQSPQEYVLVYGTRLGDLMKRIQFSERSDAASLQLFRLSVKERQKEMLDASLNSLETAALTARSGTSDEATLRKQEADLILQWVERAKKVEPSGQVFIASASDRDQLLLENGDILRVPVRDGLVLISGEVLFPRAVAFDKSLTLDAYIRGAGGYTQNANVSRIIVAHQDGSFDQANGERNILNFSGSTKIRTGDEILVLPKIDVKTRQIAKDLTQILFQIAVSAKVILGL